MELSKLVTAPRHDAGAEMRVNDEFGNPTDFYITLAGQDSTAWRFSESDKRQAAYSALTIDDETDRKSAVYGSVVDQYVSITLSWRGLVDDSGEEICQSAEAAKGVYISAPYILDQALKFVGDRGNFTGS